MVLSSEVKHGLHVAGFVTFMLVFEAITGGIRVWGTGPLVRDSVNPLVAYGLIGTIILYSLRIVSLLVLPQTICNMLGLLLYNAFKDRIPLIGSPLLAPFVCIRVVTRGDYPELVAQNVRRNIDTCLSVGMSNFMIEVVTDKAISLVESYKNCTIREVVVPSSYRTKSNALFKARALQYCLEDDVNRLSDDAYIVHLDEETILTENSVRGILNFTMDGKHQFGQGVITYANENIVNWVTTLSDSFRVSDDMGKLRFQFSTFHRPLFGWKGSFVVTQLGAERKVTYDHGPDGSVAEDCFFSMKAYEAGYSFAFIEGEMWEKSPFTFWDFLQQRKRWLQGIFLVVHSRSIPRRVKAFLTLSLYAWATIPLTTSNIVLAAVFPIPCPQAFDFLIAYIGGMNLYMYIFGVIKSFSTRYRHKPWRLLWYTLGAVATIPFNIAIENIAVMWGMFGHKHQFYVVTKDPVVFTV